MYNLCSIALYLPMFCSKWDQHLDVHCLNLTGILHLWRLMILTRHCCKIKDRDIKEHSLKHCGKLQEVIIKES